MSSSEVAPSASAEGESAYGHPLLWKTVLEFVRDGCPRMAAALAFYTVFSLPPLLVLLALISGIVTEPGAVAEVVQGATPPPGPP